MRVLRTIALVLVIVGAINWGLVGLLNLDFVATLFGGQGTLFARIVYILVGLAGVVALTIFPAIFHRHNAGHHGIETTTLHVNNKVD